MQRAVRVGTPIGSLQSLTLHGVQAGQNVTVVVRPEEIEVHATAPSGRANVLAAKITSVLFLGPTVDVRLDVDGRVVRAMRPSKGWTLREDDSAYVELPPSCVHVLPA
jgi:ABC-type Fe3+/spermidine/putrescine transport system ATPase subunit